MGLIITFFWNLTDKDIMCLSQGCFISHLNKPYNFVSLIFNAIISLFISKTPAFPVLLGLQVTHSKSKTQWQDVCTESLILLLLTLIRHDMVFINSLYKFWVLRFFPLYHRQAVVRPLWYGKDKQQWNIKSNRDGY